METDIFIIELKYLFIIELKPTNYCTLEVMQLQVYNNLHTKLALIDLDYLYISPNMKRGSLIVDWITTCFPPSIMDTLIGFSLYFRQIRTKSKVSGISVLITMLQ